LHKNAAFQDCAKQTRFKITRLRAANCQTLKFMQWEQELMGNRPVAAVPSAL